MSKEVASWGLITLFQFSCSDRKLVLSELPLRPPKKGMLPSRHHTVCSAWDYLQTVLSIRRQPVGVTLHHEDGFSCQASDHVTPLCLPASSPAPPTLLYRLHQYAQTSLGIIYHQILSRSKPAIQKRKVLSTNTTALRSQEVGVKTYRS